MLAFYLCLRQVFTAACSSPTTSALRTCWQPWTTVRNLCRRSTSRPSCTLSVDTSVTSGNMDVQSPPGLLRLFPSERLRKMSNQMMGLLSHYNQGKRTGLYGGKVTWSTECFLVCETPHLSPVLSGTPLLKLRIPLKLGQSGSHLLRCRRLLWWNPSHPRS